MNVLSQTRRMGLHSHDTRAPLRWFTDSHPVTAGLKDGSTMMNENVGTTNNEVVNGARVLRLWGWFGSLGE